MDMNMLFVIVFLGAVAVIGTASEYWLVLKAHRRIENLEKIIRMYELYRKPKRWEWRGK